jgi:hypothetical protein
MSATVDITVSFDAMANDRDATALAAGRQGVNSAFKTIESVSVAVHGDLKRLIIPVSTYFTFIHALSPFRLDGFVPELGLSGLELRY